MKNILFLFFALVIVCGPAFGQMTVQDNFSSYTYNPAAGTGVLTSNPSAVGWVILTQNASDAGAGAAGFVKNADGTVSPQNTNGGVSYGAMGWNTKLYDTSMVGIVITQKPVAPGSNTTIAIHIRMSSLDRGSAATAGATGYRVRYVDLAGTDQITISRISCNAATTQQGTDIATLNTEVGVGDTLVAKICADKSMKAMIWHTNGIRDSTTGGAGITGGYVENTYDPLLSGGGWYCWIRGGVYTTPVTVDNFMTGRDSYTIPTPPTIPVVVSQSSTPSVAVTTTPITLSTRVQGSIDSLWIFERNQSGSQITAYFKKCGATTDTTVFDTAATYGAGYDTLWVKVKDDAGIVTTSAKTTFFVGSVSGNALRYVTAFYPEFGDVSPTPAQIDWGAFNEIVIFTTEVSGTTPFFREMPGTADSANFDGGYNKRLNWVKAITDSMHAHGGKALMCLADLGGGGTMASIFGNVSNRRTLVSYLKGWIQRRNLDGLNLDWEFPAPGDLAGAQGFFQDLRDTLGPNAVISTDVPTWGSSIYTNNTAFYNGSVVSHIDLMLYRMDDGSSVLGYNSPLFQPKAQYPNYNGGSWFNNGFGQGPYDAFISKGLNASKLTAIIPFEMASKSGVTAPGQSKSGTLGYTSYSVIRGGLNAGAVENYDPVAKVPWTTFNGNFYSYENQASIAAKVDTLKKGGFAGVGIWELFRGYATNASPPDELLQWLKQAVGGTIAPPPPPNVPTLTTPANNATSQIVAQLPLAWGQASGANYYDVEVSTDSTFVDQTKRVFYATSYVPPSLSSPTITTSSRLGNSTRHFWHVRAGNGSGVSSYSTTFNFTTIALSPTTPAVPTLLTPANAATNVSTTPTLTWRPVIVDSTQNVFATYHFDIAFDAGFVSKIQTNYNGGGVIFTQADTFLVTPTLPYGTPIYWRVRSANGILLSAFSSTFSFTTIQQITPPPPPPPALTGAVFNPVTIQINGNRYSQVVTAPPVLTMRYPYSDVTHIPVTTDSNQYNWNMYGYHNPKTGWVSYLTTATSGGVLSDLSNLASVTNIQQSLLFNQTGQAGIGSLTNAPYNIFCRNQIIYPSGSYYSALGFAVASHNNLYTYPDTSGTVAVQGNADVAISAKGVISLKPTTVVAGAYTSANITVDANGRLTAAASGSAAGAGILRWEENFVVDGGQTALPNPPGNTVRAVGEKNLNINTFRSTATSPGSYGNYNLLAADSNRFGVFGFNLSGAVALSTVSGAWFSTMGTTASNFTISTFPVGDTFYFAVKTPSVGDSTSSCLGVINTTGVAAFSPDTNIAATKAGLWFQVGGILGAPDSIYAVSCNGSGGRTKTKIVGPMVQGLWYHLKMIVKATSVDYIVSSQSNNFANSTTVNLTTTLPLTTVKGYLFGSASNHDVTAGKFWLYDKFYIHEPLTGF